LGSRINSMSSSANPGIFIVKQMKKPIALLS
jgi:hypothetical protein